MTVIITNSITSIWLPPQVWTNVNLQNIFHYNCHESTILLSKNNNNKHLQSETKTKQDITDNFSTAKYMILNLKYFDLSHSSNANLIIKF